MSISTSTLPTKHLHVQGSEIRSLKSRSVRIYRSMFLGASVIHKLDGVGRV